MRHSPCPVYFGHGFCLVLIAIVWCSPPGLAAHPETGHVVGDGERWLDLDGSGVVSPADILAGIDAINGAPRAGSTFVPAQEDLHAMAEYIKGHVLEQVPLRSSRSHTTDGATGAVAGGPAMAEIVLIPSAPGPYYFGQTIDIEFFIESFDSEDHLLRLVQFDLNQSDPALGLPAELSWDFSSVLLGDSTYFVGEALPIPAVAYLGFSANVNDMLLLPGNGSLHMGTLSGVQVPSAAGSYLLDAANPGGTAPDFTASIVFGFGVEPGDDVVRWYASSGDIIGGQLLLEVIPCDSNNDCDDGDACTGVEVCDAGACLPGTPVDCDDGDACNGAEFCDAGACLPGTPIECDDGNPCNGLETCEAGACVLGVPVNCSDGIACTDDLCDINTGGCLHTTNQGFCDDEVFCNGQELCDALEGCVPGDAPCPPEFECDEQNDECFDPRIPTVSSWGLAVLTLGLLSIARVQFSRRARRAC